MALLADERPRPDVFQVVDDGADDDVDVGDAPAARTDGHGVARLDGQVGGGHRCSHSGWYVRQAVTMEGLPHPVHLGQGHGGDDTTEGL